MNLFQKPLIKESFRGYIACQIQIDKDSIQHRCYGALVLEVGSSLGTQLTTNLSLATGCRLSCFCFCYLQPNNRALCC